MAIFECSGGPQHKLKRDSDCPNGPNGGVETSDDGLHAHSGRVVLRALPGLGHSHLNRAPGECGVGVDVRTGAPSWRPGHLRPTDYRVVRSTVLLAAALFTAAFTGVGCTAFGVFAVAFTTFGDDDHDVSLLDSILSASSLNWLAT